MAANTQNVAVLGASSHPERYSHQAIRLLTEKGHRVFPINPAYQEILGHRVYPSLEAIDTPIDTLTLYLNSSHSTPMAEAITALRPARVIFNPGSESPELAGRLQSEHIPYEEACTLVLLRTGQF